MSECNSDLEIARQCKIQDISKIASKIGISNDCIKHYGPSIAKINLDYINELVNTSASGKLVLVSAINPTPAGEGKTTTTVGLTDALVKIGKRATCALREPSLGPVFGIKGGACGGGHAQVVPMEEINLHFTGDFHAIGAANNLLAAMIDAHIQNGNELDLDIKNITWKRCVDMNDRQLRHIVCGLGGAVNGVPREDGFDITVASEVMAVFCLATSVLDLKNRLANIIVGYSRAGDPIYVRDLKAQGAMCALLKDALSPNLVQTLRATPAFVHGGPFANIAHGCNSVIATKTALATSDYCVTEAGFGADLGCEKFLDIKCRMAGLKPDCVVIVATVRALKYHGGVDKADLNIENTEALKRGMPNLEQHVNNVRNVYNLPCIVAINAFPTDTQQELEVIKNACEKIGVSVFLSEVWEKGGEGALNLAQKVVDYCENGDENNKSSKTFTYAYDDNMSIEEKIDAIATKIYHASCVEYEAKATKSLKKLHELGCDNMPVCIAKTQYSFSDNASLKGAPCGFSIKVRDVKVSNGAGFVVVYAGNIMTMPGLGKNPQAQFIDVDENGQITGLF